MTENKLRTMIHVVSGKTVPGGREATFETENHSEALETMLLYWLVHGFNEVTIKREWQKTEK